MKLVNYLFFLIFFVNINNISLAKDPSDLINEIVDKAAYILSSEDPVESKIINLKRHTLIMKI